MDIFLNFGFAWISVLLALFLAAAYLTKKAFIKFPKKRGFFININKKIRKNHKIVGIVLVMTAMIHAIFSTDSLFSWNWGTACWIVSILLGINWMLRKHFVKIKGWIFYHRILVIVFLLSILIHVIDVGGIQVFKIIEATRNMNALSVEEVTDINPRATLLPENTSSPTPADSNSNHGNNIASPEPSPVPTETITAAPNYKDGTYTGTATGFQPGLQVSLIIKDNKIISIEVTDHNEINERFFALPILNVPIWIISAQNTDVDSVAGATCTSIGIKMAVDEALSKALII